VAQRLQLKATEREGTAHAIRRRGSIPAVLYGHTQESRPLALDQKTFTRIFRQAGYTTLIDLAFADEGDKAAHTVLVREVQVHPLRGSIMHVDLYQVRLDEAIRARVPLSFVGEAPAVKDLGGVLVRNLDEIELEAKPADLPHDISVDISALTEFDVAIHVKDLKVPAKVTLLHQPEEVVALVQAPRTAEELEADLAQEVTEDVQSVEGVEDKPAEGAEEAAPGEEAAAPAPEEK
jgi:large subunit ribosomal protein L25